jgi:hypothetical protein
MIPVVSDKPVTADQITEGIELAKKTVWDADLPGVVLNSFPALDDLRALDYNLFTLCRLVDDPLIIRTATSWRIDPFTVNPFMNGDGISGFGYHCRSRYRSEGLRFGARISIKTGV